MTFRSSSQQTVYALDLGSYSKHYRPCRWKITRLIRHNGRNGRRFSSPAPGFDAIPFYIFTSSLSNPRRDYVFSISGECTALVRLSLCCQEDQVSHEVQSINRVREQSRKQVQDLHGFDYSAAAELFPSRIKKGRGRVTYKRFNTAAE